MAKKEKKMITVYGEILQETEKAILVRCDDESDGAWLPKGLVKYEGERGDTDVEIQIPALLADEKGFFDGMGKPAAEASPAPAKPVTVTFYGRFDDESQQDENSIVFEVIDDNDTTMEFVIPRDQVVMLEHTMPETESASITVSRAYAVEAGMLEEIDLERGASTTPNDRHFLREETITVSRELTQKEQAEYAEEMAALDGEIQDLEDERDHVSKSLKKQIDSKEDKRRALSKIVREGKEQREITCDLTADYNTCEMVWTDTYPPHEEVQRRKMTEEERQLPLEMKDKPEVQDQDEDSEMEPARSCATCAHLDNAPAEGEADPCTDCGGDELPNWQAIGEAMPPPVDSMPETEAAQ